LKELDVGKVGRGYVATLWLGMVALALTAQVKLVLGRFGASFGRTERDDTILLLSIAFVYGIASWGVFRKQLWSYYLSLVIGADLMVNSAYNFFAYSFTGPRHWFPAILLFLGAVALAWLVSPALRSQFPLTFRKTKVVRPC
jgi:hypothetical protein